MISAPSASHTSSKSHPGWPGGLTNGRAPGTNIDYKWRHTTPEVESKCLSEDVQQFIRFHSLYPIQPPYPYPLPTSTSQSKAGLLVDSKITLSLCLPPLVPPVVPAKGLPLLIVFPKSIKKLLISSFLLLVAMPFVLVTMPTAGSFDRPLCYSRSSSVSFPRPLSTLVRASLRNASSVRFRSSGTRQQKQTWSRCY